MQSKTIPIILNQKFTKLSAFIIAYCIWYFVASFAWIVQDINIPICFYHHHNYSIQAPETVHVKITASRKQMHSMNLHHLACNVDLCSYAPGQHDIFLSEANLFLPECVKLIELYPSVISITISESSKS